MELPSGVSPKNLRVELAFVEAEGLTEAFSKVSFAFRGWGELFFDE